MTLSALRLPLPPPARGGGFRLRVTTRHIERALPHTTQRNAVALALIDQFPGVDLFSVHVDPMSIALSTLNGDQYLWDSDQIEGLSEYMHASYAEGGVQPREFDLGDVADALVLEPDWDEGRPA